jgi:beta-phosphoglucomutase family hydrolase
MIKAVIFDMDGLMIDSEPLHSQSFKNVLKEYKRTPILNRHGLVQIPGMKEVDNWEKLKEKHSLEEKVEVLIEKRGNEYLDLIQDHVHPRPGLINLLKLLDKNDIKMAVGSSSVQSHIDLILKELNITHYFEHIVSGQFVKHGKPAPDIYLEAARRLKIKPQNCLVLEDAESGVNAGFSAGMKVIAVPTSATINQDFSNAYLVLDSLEEINIEVIQSV